MGILLLALPIFFLPRPQLNTPSFVLLVYRQAHLDNKRKVLEFMFGTLEKKGIKLKVLIITIPASFNKPRSIIINILKKRANSHSLIFFYKRRAHIYYNPTQ